MRAARCARRRVRAHIRGGGGSAPDRPRQIECRGLRPLDRRLPVARVANEVSTMPEIHINGQNPTPATPSVRCDCWCNHKGRRAQASKAVAVQQPRTTLVFSRSDTRHCITVTKQVPATRICELTARSPYARQRWCGHESENLGGGHRVRTSLTVEVRTAGVDMKLGKPQCMWLPEFNVRIPTQMSRRCPIGHESGILAVRSRSSKDQQVTRWLCSKILGASASK